MSTSELRFSGLRAQALHIPFTTTFRHASAARAETASVWVELLDRDGRVIGRGESCPRPYVTGETIESAIAFLHRSTADLSRDVVSLESLRGWVSTRAGDIDRNPAAWCAAELAILDALGASSGVTVEALLGLPPLTKAFRYTAVVGDEDPEAFHALVRRYAALGFADFKVKLSGDVERDRQKLSAFSAFADRDLRVRGDANNVWKTLDEACEALDRLGFDWFALEEPLEAGSYSALAALGNELGCRIVLDESLTRREQLATLTGLPGQWIVNVRVSKMGGLLRSMAVIEEAKRRGVGIVVGAQVGETSLLTRAGLTAAHAAGESLVAQEGAFGTHLLRADVCDPPLMFGAAGVLDPAGFPTLTAAGLGPFSPDPAWLR